MPNGWRPTGIVALTLTWPTTLRAAFPAGRPDAAAAAAVVAGENAATTIAAMMMCRIRAMMSCFLGGYAGQCSRSATRRLGVGPICMTPWHTATLLRLHLQLPGTAQSQQRCSVPGGHTDGTNPEAPGR